MANRRIGSWIWAVAVMSLLILLLPLSPSFAKEAKPRTITMTVGVDCSCNSHSGEFDAAYKGKKISVVFDFNANPANPVKYPLRVFKRKEETGEWDSFLCPAPGQSSIPLSGKDVAVEGRFKNGTTFEAHKIHVMP